MHGKTHAAAGAVAGVYLAGLSTLSTFDVLTTIASSTLGSLLPDIDHPSSLINKILPTGFIAPLFGKHRGITHTIWAAGLTGSIAALFPLTTIKVVSLCVGYVSHLLLDSLNYSGIHPFYPIKGKIAFKVCRSGDSVDGAIGILLWILFMYIIINNPYLLVIGL